MPGRTCPGTMPAIRNPAIPSAMLRRPTSRLQRLAAVVLALVAVPLAAAAIAGPAPSHGPSSAHVPERLHDTGLFAPGVIAFAPRHALWSDGAEKRRWLWLPPGRTIDASQADAWRFPRGTRLWKEFAHGSRVETRYMVLGHDGQWRFASYVWAADGQSATRVPPGGITVPVESAPGGRYAIPSRSDCLTCHDGARSPVLGVSALQLGAQLPDWMRRGLLRNAPAGWLVAPPQMTGRNEVERAARGYLHANCGHCHHASGGVPVPLVLAQDVAGNPAPTREQLSHALHRMATRQPLQQMPPLGTRIPDPQGQALLRAWLDDMTRSTSTSQEPAP
jgi:hypothetical protein